VASRLGSAAATLVPVEAGPLRLSGRLGVARFGTVQGLAALERDVAGRDSITRADARAEVGAPLLLGGVLTLAPFVRGAALGYAPSFQQDASRATAWGVAGVSLETELSRRFGALRHVVAPRLEWRAGTDTVGTPLPVSSYDLYDRSTAGLLSATPGEFQQLRLSVETRLEGARGTALRAELGQDADLRSRRFAEAFAALSLAAGPLSAEGGARFFSIDGRPTAARPARIPSGLDRLSELHASLGLVDGRGDSVRAGLFSVGPGGSGRLVAGLDPLFDVRTAPLDAAATATLALRANLGAGARVGYDALLPGRPTYVASCPDPSSERRVGALQVQQHSASLSWDSPCRCFRITMSARLDDCGGYGYHASIDLARLGSGSTGASR
jgi:LPS-assembly protein